ncbi:ABC-type oligopeptide transporter ABCB9-like [Littorina saxatilis]
MTSGWIKRYPGSTQEEMPLLRGEKIKEEKSEAKGEPPRSAVCQLVKISLPDMPFILCGLLFLLGSVACEILIPCYIGKVIDGLVLDPSQQAFRAAITRLAVVAACLSFCTWARTWMFSMYVARVTARIRVGLFSSVMTQDLDFFDHHETGELVARVLSDVAVMGDSLSPNLDLCLKGLFCGVGVMMLMVQTSWQLSVLSVICLPAFAVSSHIYGVVMKATSKSSQEIMARMGEQAEENFANIRTVRSFAMEARETQLFHRAVTRLYGNGKIEAWTHSTFQPLTLLILSFLQVCALLYGGHLVQRHILSGGDLVTFVMFLNMVNTCVQIINSVFGLLTKGIGASQVVLQYLRRKPSHTATGTLVKSYLRGEVEFKDVSFSYPSRPHQTVLNKLSFRVKSGEVVALVGPSGGGKSTCVSLLQNFYRPHSGHVLLDGIPVEHYDHRCLHAKMSLVGQEPALFSRSIKDNIAYGLDACPDADIISAAKQANAHDFICAMSNGYETLAGEKGLQMSGGQKQRLAIDRALVRQPAVLLLDEATSALDSQSESKVQEALNSSREGRTVLIIAHRLSTVEKADRVVVIHRGRVVEQGSPSELLTLGGMFTSLARHQLLRTDSSAILNDPAAMMADKRDGNGDDDDQTKMPRISTDSGINFSLSSSSEPTLETVC